MMTVFLETESFSDYFAKNYWQLVIMLLIPIFAWVGNRFGHCLFITVGNMFSSHLSSLPLRPLILWSVLAYTTISFPCWVVTLSYFGSALNRRSDLEGMSLARIISTGLSLGLCFACYNAFLSAYGLAPMMKRCINAKGRILMLRRFREKRTKLLVENTLPEALGYYGRYTVVEIRGEYRRTDEVISQPLVPPGATDDTLSPMLSLVDFAEAYVRRPSRMRFTELGWHKSVTLQIQKARFVIVDVSAFSDNVAWELATVLRHRSISRLILIALDCPESRRAVKAFRSGLQKQAVSVPLLPLYYPDPLDVNFDRSIDKFVAAIRSRLGTAEEKLETRQIISITAAWAGVFCLCVLANGYFEHSVYKTLATVGNTLVVPLLIARTTLKEHGLIL